MSKPSYARVIIDRSIHRELDYLIPEMLTEKVGIGSRVRVPFREKSALATVVTLLDKSEAEGIRPIEALVGDRPVLSAKLIELSRWMSAYYCCPIETSCAAFFRRSSGGLKSPGKNNCSSARRKKLRRRK
jgi:Primosomal protein N'' (replication factor Y) - superfamily II helicase